MNTKNTKKRHREILAAAAAAIEAVGGIEAIDALPQGDRVIVLRQLKIRVYAETDCHIDVARRNVTEALRRARHPLNDIDDNWGGARIPAPGKSLGPTPTSNDQKRQPVSTRLTPGSKELAQAISKVLDLPGWGHAMELGLIALVEGDRELKVALAEMGIIVKGASSITLEREF